MKRFMIAVALVLTATTFSLRAAEPSLIGTFSRVQIATSDLSASMAWYVRMGFLPVKTPMDRADSVVTLSDGQAVITLVNAAVPSPVLVFGSQNVKGLYDTLANIDVKVNADVRGPTYRELRFTSPDGIYLLVRPIEEEKSIPRPNGTPNVMCGRHTELSLGRRRRHRRGHSRAPRCAAASWVDLARALAQRGAPKTCVQSASLSTCPTPMCS